MIVGSDLVADLVLFTTRMTEDLIKFKNYNLQLSVSTETRRWKKSCF